MQKHFSFEKIEKLLHYQNVGTLWVQYFFAYKTEVSPFQNNPQNLYLSYKSELNILDCFGRQKPILLQNFIKLSKIFGIILEGGKSCQ